MVSFDYNYQSAFRYLRHARALLHKRQKDTEYSSLLQSILVLVLKWRHQADVLVSFITLFVKIQCFTLSADADQR